MRKMIQMIPIMVPSWIGTVSVTNCSQQVHQSQHHRGFKGQTHLGRVIGVRTRKIGGIKQITMLRGGRSLGSFHRSPFSVVAALVLPAHQMAKRSRVSMDEVSKVRGASSKPNHEGKRLLSLAAVRHHKSSTLIPAQEKTWSDFKD